jgi:hypothetical protein
MIHKKGTKELGIGILAFAMILLIGGILSDNPVTFSEKEKYLDDKQTYYNEEYPEENYLFYLEDFDLGKEQRITQNFPNIELGAKEEFIPLYTQQIIELRSNMFKQNIATLRVVPTSRKDLKELRIYASANQLSGSENVIVKIDGKEVAQVPVEGYFPIIIKNFPENNTFDLTIELNKPAWYQLFNWNKAEFKDFRVVEISQNLNEQTKEFSFDIDDRQYLDELLVQLVVSCESRVENSPSIKVKVNGYIIGNQNPDCISRFNRMTFNISENILNKENQPNVLELETEGYYTLGYSIVKSYYNDQETYKFTVEDFSDIFDVIMYGDFDKESIEVEINNRRITLNRNEIESIIPFLRAGVNTIEFRDMPLEIDEFVVESITYRYDYN